MARLPLPQKIKIVSGSVPAVTAIGAVTPVEVNGTGYDRCMWIIYTGAAGAGATLSAKIQNSATSGGALADITSAASAGMTAAANASKVHVIDHAVSATRPFMKLTGAAAVDTFATAVIAVLYNGRKFPVATSYATEFVQV